MRSRYIVRHCATEDSTSSFGRKSGGKRAIRRAVTQWLEALESRRLLASIATDRIDYNFGETALISGAEFQPGEMVQLQVTHAEGTVGSNDDEQNQPWQVQADAEGNLASAWVVDDPDALDATYVLRAIGMSSGDFAQTQFTDSVTSVTLTSPTSASPAVVGAPLPKTVTVAFSYVTSTTGATSGLAEIKLGATTYSATKSLTAGSFSDSIIVTIPAGATNGSYDVKITVTNNTAGGPNSRSDQQNNAVKVDTVGPTASGVAATPSPTKTAPTLTANLSDTLTNVTAAEFFIDASGSNGTGIAMNATDGSFNSTSEGVTKALTAAQFNGLSEGTHTLYVHGLDVAGNWGAFVSVDFVKDTVALKPAAPDMAAGSDTGNSNSDDLTNETRPVFTGANGSAEAGATLAVFDGATSLGTTTVSGTGSWTFTVPPAKAFSNGPHSITAVVTDAAGNVSPASDALPIFVDLNKPTVTINQATGQADPTNSGPIHFTVVFNETVTGFTSSDVVLGGTAGATTAVVTGSGPTYDVEVSGMTLNGTVTASVPANRADDLAGNGNTVSSSIDNSVTFQAVTNITAVITAFDKTYNGTAAANISYSLPGVVSGDDVTLTWTSAEFDNRNAGFGKLVTVLGLSLSGTDAGKYALTSTSATDTADVFVRTLSISAATNSKTYDGTTDAAATPTSSGLQTGDSLTGLVEEYDNRNAGTGKTLSVSDYNLSDGNGGNNYSVSLSDNTTGVINRAGLSIYAATNTRTYNGTKDAAATPTYSGLQTGDSLTGLVEEYDNRNAGTGKTLSVSDYNLSDGNGGDNYDVSLFDDTTGVINRAGLSIYAVTNTRTYNGTKDAAATPTYSGLQTGDSLTGLVEEYDNRNAGTGKTLSVSDYNLSDGNGGNNYTVSLFDNTTGVINRAGLSIYAVTNTRTYNGTKDAAATPTYSGLQTGDSLTGLVEEYDNRNAGTGKTLSVSDYNLSDGNSGNNYTVSLFDDTTGVINRAGLSIYAATNTRTYNGTKDAAATPTYSGLQTGDSLTGLVEEYDNRNAGTGKTLSVSDYNLSDGNSGNNYNVALFDNTTGVINRATLTISAAANTKTYDGTPSAAATPTFSGLQTGDSLTGLTEAYDNRNAGTSKTLGVTAYTLSDGNGGNNYTVSLQDSHAGVINRAALIICAATNTKTYDGTRTAIAVPTFTGLQTGDSLTGLVEQYDNKNAGTSKTLSVSAYSLSDGNAGNNYNVTLKDSLTGVINRANLTISAVTNTKPYDGTRTASAVPTFSGLQIGDSLTGLVERYDNKNAGTSKTLSVSAYNLSDGNLGNNYNVSLNDNLTGVINRIALIVTASDRTKLYGDLVTFTGNEFSTSGLIVGDVVGPITLTSTGAPVGAVVAGSPYAIVASGGSGVDATNYNMSYVNGKLTVTPREAFSSYIGQTIFVTSGTSSTTAQVTLSASIQDPDGSGSITAAKVTFKDLLTGQILASNVPVALVNNTNTSLGTANVVVTLSSGQYGVSSYLIEVSLSGSYKNTQQTGATPGTDAYNAAHASTTVMQPAVNNSMAGAGTIGYLATSAGSYVSDTSAAATYSFGLKYNKGGSNPQGQILLMIPRSDGMYCIKSNSITSVAIDSIRGTATVYTKANISKLLANGTTVSLDSGVTLRLDVKDGAIAGGVDQVGFTVLSSKTSALFFSNNWVYDPITKAWRTMLQDILVDGPGVRITGGIV